MQILDGNLILDPAGTSPGSWASPLLFQRFTEASAVKSFLFEKFQGGNFFVGKIFHNRVAPLEIFFFFASSGKLY
jgi:hypothetical protein